MKDLVEKKTSLVVIFCSRALLHLQLLGVKLGDMRVGLSSHGFGSGNPFDATSLTENVCATPCKVLYHLVGALCQVAYDDELAWGDMEQSGLDLTAHETVLKVVIDDVTRCWLDSDDADIDFLIGAVPFAWRLSDAQQVPSSWCAGVILGFQVAILIDVRAFGVNICQLPDKGGIAVVAGLLQRRSLDLSHDTDFVPGSDQSLGVDGKPVYRNTRGGELVQVGFGWVLVVSKLPRNADNTQLLGSNPSISPEEAEFVSDLNNQNGVEVLPLDLQ